MTPTAIQTATILDKSAIILSTPIYLNDFFEQNHKLISNYKHHYRISSLYPSCCKLSIFVAIILHKVYEWNMNKILHSIFKQKSHFAINIAKWLLTYFKSSFVKAPGSNCSTVTSFFIAFYIC